MSSLNNGFESINLASTIQSEYPGLNEEIIPIKKLQSIPVSTSEDEDEDDELDPGEFISTKDTKERQQQQQQPFVKQFGSDGASKKAKKEETPALLLSTIENLKNSSKSSFNSLRDSELMYNQDSIMIKSIKFPTEVFKDSYNNNSESPIEYLSNRVKLLTQQLLEDSMKYNSYLQNGSSNIYQLRNKIVQTYNQLSESYYSLSELYNKDINYAESLHDSFKKWDRQRSKVIAKVKSIKSDSNKHGAKLFDLLDESNEIDEEIQQLESKLEQLRAKKVLVNKEIEDTSSVLESRTAKYVDVFRNLEKQGKLSILNFLQSNAVPAKDIESIVKYSPVDATILKDYSKKRASSSQLVSPPEEIKPVVPAPTNNNNIGMQPFIVPEEEEDHKENVVSPQDLLSMNHDHGPTPFERGFAKGTQNSTLIKTKMNQLVKKFFDSLPEQNTTSLASSTTPSTSTSRSKPPKVDDVSNTITEKLDLEPIMKFLEYKAEALQDLTKQTSLNAALFHEFGSVWQSVTKLMNLQEEKLENVLNESIINGENKLIIAVLSSTLDNLTASLNKVRSVASDNQEDQMQRDLLIDLISHECDAVLEAIKIVQTNEGSPTPSDSGRLHASLMPSSSKPTSQVNKAEVKSTTKIE
ncbi:Autophagy-related protein 28 [Candida viswanathii]|uniref:Autophagy-related protein 28 n=1 Tax=Candida viswanathii TaxID=5486 RepID=A0A367YHU4_9ASCO|nr:Autophagy-related protein 28 [Candida viswanathii]